MNQDFLNKINAALSRVTEILGDCFYYGGATYLGVINDVETITTLESGGLLEGLVTIIVVQRCQLPTAPTVGQTLKAKGQTMRIEKVRTDEISHTLTCVSAAN